MRIQLIIILLSTVIGQNLIGEGLYETELINFLRENYTTSNTLGYTKARDTLYFNIDRIDGQVQGIYTNYAMNLPEGVDPSTFLYENGINCEHIWPQSLGAGSEPMKSDMHIIRPCKDNVNSSRGNKPYNEIIDSQTDTWYWLNNQVNNTPSSNIDEYSENSESSFEPREDRKGDIARTIYYFYTIYPNVADENFFNIQKEILKLWHENDPIDNSEIIRTWKIAEYQENKPNPFILDATLIERAYFFEGNLIGDLNGDTVLNILDIVELINIILNSNEYNQIGDLNDDNNCNILDVVILVGIILS